MATLGRAGILRRMLLAGGGTATAGVLLLLQTPWDFGSESMAWLETRLSPIELGALIFVAWAVGGVMLSQIVYWAWRHVFLALARRVKNEALEVVLTEMRTPIRVVLVVTALNLGYWDGFGNMAELSARPGWVFWQGLLYVLLVLSITAVAYAATGALAKWYGDRLAAGTSQGSLQQAASVFRKVAKLVFLFIALTIIFSHFNVQIMGLLATAGVASLAIAFAAQETLANMIAGFALMVDRPFRAGDRIQLANGQMGDVIEVGLRSTRVLSFDNTMITIPNAEIAKSQVINLNAPDANVKIRATLGVAYGTDLRKAKAILMAVMAENPRVMKEPAPAVYFAEFAESSLNLLFICWVADYRDKFAVLDELNMAIKDRFEAGGIEIPFPQRDVHVHTVGLPVGATASAVPPGPARA